MKLKVELEHATLRVAHNLISDRIDDLGRSIKFLMKDKSCPKDVLEDKMKRREKLREAHEDIGRLHNEFS